MAVTEGRREEHPFKPFNKKITRRALIGVAGAAALGTGAYVALGRGSGNEPEPKQGVAVNPDLSEPTKVSPTSTTEPSPTLEKKIDPKSLKEGAKLIGSDIGVNLEKTALPGMVTVLSREFNLGVISPGMTWAQVEPRKNEFDFKIPDTLQSQFSSSMILRLQGLVFPQRNLLPGYIFNLSPRELGDTRRNHITTITEHFKGKVKQVVVSNEAGIPGWRNNDVFLNNEGEVYIDDSFEIVHQIDPQMLKIFNDNSNEISNGPATRKTRERVHRLNSKGLNVAVGLQCHLDGANPPARSDLIATAQSYEAPVVVTELDVNMRNVQGSPEERLIKQADIYEMVCDAYLRSGVCRSITVWNVGDKNSWIETTTSYPYYSPNADPTLFTDDLLPKPHVYSRVLGVYKNLASEQTGKKSIIVRHSVS